MAAGCEQCEGTGTVVCINCQGSGVSVPEDILQKLGDSEAGLTEEDYIGLFDEVKFPTLLNVDADGAAPAAPAPTASATAAPGAAAEECVVPAAPAPAPAPAPTPAAARLALEVDESDVLST